MRNFAQLLLIAAFNLRCLADSHVELELDATNLAAAEEKAGGRGNVGGGKAQAVFAGVGCGEGELAIGAATLRDNAVIVVEEFIDGYVDALAGGQRW